MNVMTMLRAPNATVAGLVREDLRNALNAALPAALMEAELRSGAARDRREEASKELAALTRRLNKDARAPRTSLTAEEQALVARLDRIEAEVRDARAALRQAREDADDRRVLQVAAVNHLRQSVPQIDMLCELIDSLVGALDEPARVAMLHGLQPPQLGIVSQDLANLKRFADLVRN